MKYYFITYQAISGRSTSVWNQVIEGSPMKFIKRIEATEEAGSNNYKCFAVINTCEITYDEFKEYDGHF